MLNLLYRVLAQVTGKNLESTPTDVILDQLNEPRALPLGRKEFDAWADRLIKGAMLPPAADEDAESFYFSQKYALANMIMHLGPTESHKPDAHFIHTLRKVACNQVAHATIMEIKTARDEKAKSNVTPIGAPASA